MDFRDEPRPEIQFITEGLPRDIEPSEQTGEETSRTVGESPDSAMSFVERAGKSGGVKEYSSKTTESAQCPQETIKPLCIGNGQLHDALTPSEVCKTLNTMEDPMKVVCIGMVNQLKSDYMTRLVNLVSVMD